MKLLFRQQSIVVRPLNQPTNKTWQSRVQSVNDEVVTISAVDLTNNPIPASIGEEVEIYVTRPDAIYSVTTRVLDKKVRPLPSLILDNEEVDVQRKQRRQAFRVDVRVPTEMTFMTMSSDGEKLRAEQTYTRNLSAGGLYCLVKTPCRMGDEAQVRLTLPTDRSPIDTFARIRRVRTGTTGRSTAATFVGLSFEQIKTVDQSRLQSFLFRVQSRTRDAV